MPGFTKVPKISFQCTLVIILLIAFSFEVVRSNMVVVIGNFRDTYSTIRRLYQQLRGRSSRSWTNFAVLKPRRNLEKLKKRASRLRLLTMSLICAQRENTGSIIDKDCSSR